MSGSVKRKIPFDTEKVKAALKDRHIKITNLSKEIYISKCVLYKNMSEGLIMPDNLRVTCDALGLDFEEVRKC
jgi:hypothetical protein